MSTSTYLIDSSVEIAALNQESKTARRFLATAHREVGPLVASQMLQVEVWRYVRRRRLRGLGAPPDALLDDRLARYALVPLSEQIGEVAAHLEPMLRGADALHIATALLFGPATITIVTADREMRDAARELGFEVVDPVNAC